MSGNGNNKQNGNVVPFKKGNDSGGTTTKVHSEGVLGKIGKLLNLGNHNLPSLKPERAPFEDSFNPDGSIDITPEIISRFCNVGQEMGLSDKCPLSVIARYMGEKYLHNGRIKFGWFLFMIEFIENDYSEGLILLNKHDVESFKIIFGYILGLLFGSKLKSEYLTYLASKSELGVRKSYNVDDSVEKKILELYRGFLTPEDEQRLISEANILGEGDELAVPVLTDLIKNRGSDIFDIIEYFKSNNIRGLQIYLLYKQKGNNINELLIYIREQIKNNA